jgi:hypothetical protein
MRRILICTGVLGGGTALAFAAAALTAMLIPPTQVVPQSRNVVFDTVMPANVGGPALTVSGAGPGPVVVAIPAPAATP